MRKKHWPLNINVTIPGQNDPLKLEVASTMRVKNLKRLIYDTVENKEGLPLERIQLAVDGGEVLLNGMKGLDEYNLKDGNTLTIEILDKSNVPTPRERKPREKKEEQKVPVTYNVRG